VSYTSRFATDEEVAQLLKDADDMRAAELVRPLQPGENHDSFKLESASERRFCLSMGMRYLFVFDEEGKLVSNHLVSANAVRAL